jgi:hypothetical protein
VDTEDLGIWVHGTSFGVDVVRGMTFVGWGPFGTFVGDGWMKDGGDVGGVVMGMEVRGTKRLGLSVGGFARTRRVSQ